MALRSNFPNGSGIPGTSRYQSRGVTPDEGSGPISQNSITDSRLYLVSVTNPNKKMEIQFVPKELSFVRSIEQNEVKIVGRNNPIYHYSGGADSFSMELDFYTEEDNREDVMKRVNWLDSFTMNDGQNKPENIKIIFGDFFKKGEIWLIKSLDKKFSNFNRRHGFLPQQAYVNITFVLDTPKNRSHSDLYI